MHATITWASGAWRYVVRDDAFSLEEGTLGGAGPTESSAVLRYLLQLRWPGLPPAACAVVRGPEALEAADDQEWRGEQRASTGADASRAPAAVRAAW